MVAFVGYRCDVCNKVWEADSCTVVRTTFRGLAPYPSLKRDVCPECIQVLYPQPTEEAPAPIFE